MTNVFDLDDKGGGSCDGGRRFQSRRKRSDGDGRCEIYDGDSPCDAFRSNQTVFVDRRPSYSQQHVATFLRKVVVDTAEPYLTSVNPNYPTLCKRIVRETLCFYYFPPCNVVNGTITWMPWCRDNCEQLVKSSCFKQARDVALLALADVLSNFLTFLPIHVNAADLTCPRYLPETQPCTSVDAPVIQGKESPWITIVLLRSTRVV